MFFFFFFEYIWWNRGVWKITLKCPFLELKNDPFSWKQARFDPISQVLRITFSLKNQPFFRVSLVIHVYNTSIRVGPTPDLGLNATSTWRRLIFTFSLFSSLSHILFFFGLFLHSLYQKVISLFLLKSGQHPNFPVISQQQIPMQPSLVPLRHHSHCDPGR